MRIAIVEDNARDMEQLRGVIEAYAAERGAPVEIDAFSSGADFQRDFAPGKYGLVFFDNYIDSGLGIDLARRARAVDEAVEFVFVSTSPDFAVSSFEVRALHYLLKPVAYDAVAGVFDRLWKHAARPDVPMLEVTVGHRPTLLPVPSIRYIQVVDKTCLIHAQEDIPVYMRLEKLLELLPPGEFVRTHKSYAVRLGAVKAMGQNEFHLKDGAVLPIGRAYQTECKTAFIEYLVRERERPFGRG